MIVPGSINLDFVRQDPTRYCLIVGVKGTLRWDGIAGTIDFFAAGSKKWENIL